MPDLSSPPPAPEAFVVLLPSRLIEPAKQPAMAAMADFMALTRAIADDVTMASHLRAAHMTALEGTMTTQEGYVPMPKGVPPTIVAPGFRLRRECDNRKISVAYARRIVQAYSQDIAKKGYRDWSDLLAYFRFSAGASAHYTVEVLGLDKAQAPAVEALASAHALLARMISVRADVARAKRCYLPLRWLNDAGLDTEELSIDGNAAAWLKVRDQGVIQARQLLAQATPGLKSIKDRKLRLAFAWAKSDVAGRCDAVAGSPAFPVAAMPKPSLVRRVIACARDVF